MPMSSIPLETTITTSPNQPASSDAPLTESGAQPGLTADGLPAKAVPPAEDPLNPTSPPHPPISEEQAARSLELAMAAARTALDNRGQDVRVLDVRHVTPEFDYFVVATGNSRRQLHAISEEIDHRLEDDLGDKRMGIEGYEESRWILLDYGSIVIHLFDEETRDFYAIEDLWTDALSVELPWTE